MISVIICTRDRSLSLLSTLASFTQMMVPSELKWELIVVDNSSTANNTRKVVTAYSIPGWNVKYVFEPRQGLSYARNTGIANSRGEIIAFTDDDVRVTAQWLAGLANTFTEFDCIAVGGRIIQTWDGINPPKWLCGCYLRMANGVIPYFDHGKEAKLILVPPVGANMAFRKSAFEKYGLFLTHMGLGSKGVPLGAEFEFALRLLRAGERVAYSPRAAVFHPAERYRIKKPYFLRYYYNLGRTDVQLKMTPPAVVHYFGIPRWMFRTFYRRCASWLFTLGPKRFFHKVQLYRLVGQMREARGQANISHGIG